MQVGHLDGIRDGEVYGWAFDSNRLDEAIKIAVHVDSRPVAEALAGYYRPDVAAHFKNSGRHAFFVDLTRICVFDGEVNIDVRLPNGNSLEGAPIRARVPRQSPKQEPTLVFLHIPKTAGTSMREAILRNYKKSAVIYLYPQEPGFPIQSLSELPLEQRARSRLIVGHWAYYGTHEQIPNDCLYFTVVRDPVSRVWSHYTHIVQSQDPRVRGDTKLGTLEEIFESKSKPELDNLMVRYFAGMPDILMGSVNLDIYERARQHLQQAFPYVGHQQKIDQAYAWLQTRLNWNSTSPVPIINVTEYVSTTRCGESDKKLIRHFNQWDCRLYENMLSSHS